MFRRMIINLAACMFLAGMVLTAYAIAMAPSATPDSIIYTNPKPVHTMPACTTEDGAGMALCTWDAQKQGNGQGESVISGDCASSIMGDASEVCVALHARASMTIPNSDGSSNTIPNGADLIAECAMEFKGTQLQECIAEWL